MRLRNLVSTDLGARLLGGAAIVNGSIWLLLWFSGIAARWSGEGVNTVKTNMALCQLLAGAGLVLLAPRETGELRRRVGIIVAAVVLVTGVFTLSEHLFSYNAGIDQLLASEPSGAVATASPNRMGPPGSSSLVLVGAGLLLLAFERARLAAWLGLCVCVINLIPAVGFLYGIAGFYSIPRLTGISWPTVVVLLSLGGGLILIRPAEGPAAQLLRDDAGGMLLRRLVPAVIVIPLVVGYLGVLGEERGWHERAAGTGAVMIILVLGFLWILWRTAEALSKAAEAKGKAEEKLREKEHRYRRLLDDDLTGDFISTPEGRILLCNPAFARMFGFSSVEEAVGTNVADLYVDGGERKPLVERVTTEGKVERLEVWRKRRDGASIYVVENVIGYFDERGELNELNAYLFDDTKRKRGEEALRESEERLGLTLQASEVGTFEIDLCTAETRWNTVEYGLLGLRPGEAPALPETFFRFVHHEDVAELKAEWEKASRNGRLEAEFRVIRADGQERWLAAKGQFLPAEADARGGAPNESGPKRFLGVNFDITERKRAEEKLRESEERFRVAQELSPDGFTILRPVRDEGGRVVDFTWVYENATIARLNGTDAKVVVGRRLSEFLPSHAATRFHEVYCRVAETRKPEVLEEHYEGDVVPRPTWFRVAVVSMGQDIAILAQDITARKRVECELAEQARLLDLSSDAIIVRDRADEVIYWNKGAEQLYGYSRAEALGRMTHELLKTEFPESVTGIYDTMQREKKWEGELIHARKDGSRVTTLSRWVPDSDPQGGMKALLETNTDISGRKTAEAALREERDFSAAVLDTAGALVVVLDTAGRIRRFNRACAALTGYAEAEVLGQPVWFLIPPEDVQGVREEWNTLSSGTVRSQHENQWLAKDGTRRLIAWSNTVLAGSNGEVLHVIGTGLDITERRRAEEALKESEAGARRQFEELEAIYRTSPVGLCVFDRDLRYRRINSRVAEMNGVPAEEHLGKTVREVVPSLGDQAEEVLRRVIETRQPVRFEFRGETPAQPGSQRIWDEQWFPLLSETGGIDGVGVVVEDITERKAFQAELERLVHERTAKLHELVGELEHFSYTITHDLKSPLRAMRGFAEIAGELCERSEVKEWLGKISAAAERMDLLIRDALSYSRAVRQELPLEDVDVGALLRGMLDSYPELQSEKARIRVEGNLPVVLANEAGVTQVFSNLLGNAVKFVKPREKPDIKVWAQEPSTLNPQLSGWVRIWVEDKGIGISKSMLPRVFEMFSRGSKSYEGTGIGLALVRKVVQRMGGKLGVESEEGKGSRFWIELKCGEGEAMLTGTSVRSEATQAEAAREGTVLYVEDEESDVLFMEQAFQGRGLEGKLQLVGDGRAAIDYLSGAGKYGDREKHPVPTVVLLDLNLPQVPGFEVLAWMRNHPDYTRTPVVVFSASTRADDRAKARELGANEFVVKPSSAGKFGEVVEGLRGKWMGRRHA